MDWNSKATKKHIGEAKAASLTIIGPGRNNQCRTYQFNDCGHEQQFFTSSVRSGCFRCDQCFQAKLSAEAKAVGLTLIGAGRDANYRTYRFDECEHEQEIETSKVRKDSFKCDQCFQAKLSAEAKAVGLTLLGPGENAHVRLYRFNDCDHEQEIGTGNVRANKLRCDQCLQAKLKKEAKAAGLTLLGPGKTAHVRLYQFNDCGHERELQTGLVRKDSFKCDQCLQAKLKKEAKAAGLTLLGPASSSKNRVKDYRLYRFNDCGHEQEIGAAMVRIDGFRCDQCLQAKFRAEAEAASLTLLGPGKTHHHRLYRFNDCGHEQEIETGHVRKDSFKCDQCFQAKLKREAKAAGLTLLGPASSSKNRVKDYRLYRFNDCGHEREIQTGAVRIDGFRCHQCEETSLDFPSHVYLLEIQAGEKNWLKLGFAKTISTRIKSYGLSKSAKATKLIVIDFETGREAHAYESSLHKKYRRRRLPVKRMKKFHTRNGYNECYPMNMLDTLMDELTSIKT